MAVATIAQQKTRVETLCALVPGIETVLTGAETIIPLDSLPAIEVRIGGARRESMSMYERLVTRDFELWLFFMELPKPESDNLINIALEALYPISESLPDFFMMRPRLENGDAGIVYGIGEMSDNGPAPSPYKGKYYAVNRYILPVLTIHNINS